MTRPTKLLLAAVVLVAILAAVFWFQSRESPASRARALYWQAAELAAERKLEDAEELVREAVALNGGFNAAHKLAAECAIARNDFEQALRDLSQITDPESDDWLPARKIAADLLHNRVCRFREAERVYREILSVDPDDTFADEGYARLLGLCGRRNDAIPHVLRLVRSGKHTDLLMLLSRESGALNDPEMLEKARQADPTDPNPLLGQAQAAASAQNPSRALELLEQAARLEGLPKDFQGRLGRQLLACQRFDELNAWAQSLPPSPDSFESWIVLAEMAERAGNPQGAIRCCWEAVRRRPESLEANNRLARLLTSANHPHEAEVFHRRVEEINALRDRQERVLMANERPELAEILKMLKAYQSVGRFWEAMAWGRMALEAAPDNPELQRIVSALQTNQRELPLTLTAPENNPANHVDLSRYPVPSIDTASPQRIAGAASNNISFKQERGEVGFDFTYFDGTPGTTYRMFELAGGGIAVLDYDNDGAPDLFLTQGRTWGKRETEPDGRFDRLFQNRAGRSFLEVAEKAGFSAEAGFGQGAAAGDFNNDGFADLYVANTGRNALWLNNGDGTFSEHSDALADRLSQWTTSCLIADLNGDSFPDLYDVNYLSGDDLFDRLCLEKNGDKSQCGPQDFEPAMDRVWLSDGAGGFRDRTTDFLVPPPNGKGLGIAAMDTGSGGLSLFVANDTTANFFYRPDSPKSMVESAVVSGLGFNRDGKAEACMGIAVGDCNQDGLIDLLVTNFLYESNTLYSQQNKTLFEDRTREFGLHEPTLPFLGFGTQFLDANLDGRLEAFIANGYTHDVSKHGTPYKMLPQFFEWTGERFQELPPGQIGSWSETKSVGRAVAKLDWNLDGKPDLAVGLLEAASYLLTNTSETAENRFLTLKLVATKSARDAVGTRVTALVGGLRSVHQLTAGDGYQCSNERRISIGCGPSEKIDRLTVVWPSGATQEFAGVETSRSLLLVEGEELLEIR